MVVRAAGPPDGGDAGAPCRGAGPGAGWHSGGVPEPASVDPLSPLDVAALRRSYALAGVDESDVDPDPHTQFDRWLAEAVAARVLEPNAMVCSTATPDGRPSSRTVLLKGHDVRGFTWYTGYGSRKGRELAANPWASLLFPWYALERQVVVTGRVERVGREETAAYFASRPHGSRLGAWASEQSSVIPSRDVLEARWAELAERWPEGTDVPLPDRWGGFRLVPDAVELWQGRPSRLHDRLRYRLDGDAWVLERLSP